MPGSESGRPAGDLPAAQRAWVGQETPATDAELLRRHVAGDHDAFGTLFQRHRERLWGVALRTLGDPDDAADALQEAMISAFRRAAGFRGDAAVTTWLHRIVINACLDRLRRQAARPTTSTSEERTLTAAALIAATPGAIGDSDISLDVEAALRTLPPQQRAALVLVDMLGYPLAEAADALGVPVGTVKSRCARGRARLLPRLAHLRGPVEQAETAPRSPAAGAGLPSPPVRPVPARRTGRRAGPGPAAGNGPPGNRTRPGDVSPSESGGESLS